MKKKLYYELFLATVEQFYWRFCGIMPLFTAINTEKNVDD